MKVSGEHYAPAALSLRKKSIFPIEKESGWHQGRYGRINERKTLFLFTGIKKKYLVVHPFAFPVFQSILVPSSSLSWPWR